MAILHEILEHNSRFVAQRSASCSKVPQRRVAIFTCMDTRLVEFLEPAMGLGRGDAKVIKNAGNSVIDPQGGVVRSIVVAVHALGCREIFVIGHTDCGMSQIDVEKFRQTMLDSGVPAEAIDSLQPSLAEWLGAFHRPEANVEKVVDILRDSPLLPNNIPIHGLIFEPQAGRLDLITDGYEAIEGSRAPAE